MAESVQFIDRRLHERDREVAPIDWHGPPGFTFDLNQALSTIYDLPPATAYGTSITGPDITKMLPILLIRAKERGDQSGMLYHDFAHTRSVAFLAWTATLDLAAKQLASKRPQANIINAGHILIQGIGAPNHEIGEYWLSDVDSRTFFKEELAYFGLTDVRLVDDVVTYYGASRYPNPQDPKETAVWRNKYLGDMAKKAGSGDVFAQLCLMHITADYAAQCFDEDIYWRSGEALQEDWKKRPHMAPKDAQGHPLSVIGPSGAILVAPGFYNAVKAYIEPGLEYFPENLKKQMAAGHESFYALTRQTALLLGQSFPEPIQFS